MLVLCGINTDSLLRLHLEAVRSVHLSMVSYHICRILVRRIP